MNRIRRVVSVLIAAVMIMPGVGFAEAKPEVLHASTIEEYIDATDAGTDCLISIDKITGTVDGSKSFESVFGKSFEDAASGGLKDAVEADDLYIITDENKRSIEALSVFGTRRIKVKKELTTLEGAEEGVCYQGNTLLSYRTIEETQAAFRMLVAKYGADNVIPDLPIIGPMSNSWGMDYMNLDDEKRRHVDSGDYSGSKVTVAVLDSGINSDHEIFRGTRISEFSKNIIDSSGDISDETGHGTKVAGIIAETTPDNVELMVISVFGEDGLGSTEDINQAVAYAAEHGADVINMSMGACLYELLNYIEIEGGNPQVYMNELEEQLKNASLKKAVICTAAGNEGRDIDTFVMYPAYSRFSITVGSIDNKNRRSDFSNYGSSMDFCAPGTDLSLASNTKNDGYVMDSGTSFATPYITACCAYLKMNDKSTTVTTARNSLKTIATDLGTEGWDKEYGWGMPRYEEYINEGGGSDEDDDQAAADRVIALINMIPALGSITSADSEIIMEARKEYELLTDVQKERVEPYSLKKLEDSERELAALNINPSDDDNNTDPSNTVDQLSPSGEASHEQQNNIGELTINSAVIDSATVQKLIQTSGGSADTLVIGKKVKKIRKGSLAGTNIKSIVVKTKKLKKKSVRGSLKGSKVKTVKVQVGSTKTNKKYVRKYKKIFTKKNAGKKVKVKK